MDQICDHFGENSQLFFKTINHCENRQNKTKPANFS